MSTASNFGSTRGDGVYLPQRFPVALFPKARPGHHTKSTDFPATTTKLPPARGNFILTDHAVGLRYHEDRGLTQGPNRLYYYASMGIPSKDAVCSEQQGMPWVKTDLGWRPDQRRWNRFVASAKARPGERQLRAQERKQGRQRRMVARAVRAAEAARRDDASRSEDEEDEHMVSIAESAILRVIKCRFCGDVLSSCQASCEGRLAAPPEELTGQDRFMLSILLGGRRIPRDTREVREMLMEILGGGGSEWMQGRLLGLMSAPTFHALMCQYEATLAQSVEVPAEEGGQERADEGAEGDAHATGEAGQTAAAEEEPGALGNDCGAPIDAENGDAVGLETQEGGASNENDGDKTQEGGPAVPEQPDGASTPTRAQDEASTTNVEAAPADPALPQQSEEKSGEDPSAPNPQDLKGSSEGKSEMPGPNTLPGRHHDRPRVRSSMGPRAKGLGQVRKSASTHSLPPDWSRTQMPATPDGSSRGPYMSRIRSSASMAGSTGSQTVRRRPRRRSSACSLASSIGPQWMETRKSQARRMSNMSMTEVRADLYDRAPAPRKASVVAREGAAEEKGDPGIMNDEAERAALRAILGELVPAVRVLDRQAKNPKQEGVDEEKAEKEKEKAAKAGEGEAAGDADGENNTDRP